MTTNWQGTAESSSPTGEVWIEAADVTEMFKAVEDYSTAIYPNTDILAFCSKVAQPYFESVSGKVFELQTFEETLDGDGTYDLYLSKRPIDSVEILRIDGTLIDASDIYVYQYKIGCKQKFCRGRRNIYVKYKAGKLTVDTQAKRAVALLCALRIIRNISTGSGAISSAIIAGPITIKESFSAEGKYSDKVRDWAVEFHKILKSYNSGVRISGDRTPNTPGLVYNPRTDSWE